MIRTISLFIVLLGASSVQLAMARDPISIRPVPLTDVDVRDGFWGPRFATNRAVTVDYDFHKCEETGRIANFAVAGGITSGGFQGIFFNDSDVFKVIEGAAYCLATQPDAKLEQYLDPLIAKIAAAQEDDGYLYTVRTINDPNYDYPGREARWSNLESGHELYNAGHLYEAAVAHWHATGKNSLMNVAIKHANLVCRVFGTAEGQRKGVPGHEEIEIGLMKLFHATGDPKYAQQAKFFIDMRGRSDQRQIFGTYCQDHLPVVEQAEAVGHAVRAGYLYAAVADVAAFTGDKTYLRAITRIWENIVSKKMYLTGGVGALRQGEAFAGDYELPNDVAYNETCAAIAQALFNQRMFVLTGDGKYIDVLERLIYNGFLSGVSLSGDRFFYPNPLACDGKSPFNQGVLGRSPWFGCSCCPVNVVRFIPSIAGYVYAATDDSIYVNLYIAGKGRLRVADTEVTLRQETRYPWDGKVRLELNAPEARTFAIRLRMPGWSLGHPLPSDLYTYTSKRVRPCTIRLNGDLLDAPADAKGYAVLRRTWNAGDVIEIEFPMAIQTVKAHDQVTATRGRVALEYGPIVYCFEAIDNGESVSDIVLPSALNWQVEHRRDLLGGVNVLSGAASRATRDRSDSIALNPITAMAVPYYAWAHRQVGEMAVWVASDLSTVRARPASPSVHVATIVDGLVDASHGESPPDSERHFLSAELGGLR